MTDGLGITFAPTQEQADRGSRQGGLEGVPEAIRVLSLRMPRFFGGKAPAPDALLHAKGAQGVDPYLPAVFQSLARALAPNLDMTGGVAAGGAAGEGFAPAPLGGSAPAPKVEWLQPDGGGGVGRFTGGGGAPRTERRDPMVPAFGTRREAGRLPL